jgi:hypothetical protein
VTSFELQFVSESCIYYKNSGICNPPWISIFYVEQKYCFSLCGKINYLGNIDVIWDL